MEENNYVCHGNLNLYEKTDIFIHFSAGNGRIQ